MRVLLSGMQYRSIDGPRCQWPGGVEKPRKTPAYIVVIVLRSHVPLDVLDCAGQDVDKIVDLAQRLSCDDQLVLGEPVGPDALPGLEISLPARPLAVPPRPTGSTRRGEPTPAPRAANRRQRVPHRLYVAGSARFCHCDEYILMRPSRRRRPHVRSRCADYLSMGHRRTQPWR